MAYHSIGPSTPPAGSTAPRSRASQGAAGARQVGSGAEVSKLRRSTRIVAARRTPTSPVRFRSALSRAYRAVTGKPASATTLDILGAHVSHETGRGLRMYNYNFGGIKGASPGGMTARYPTFEHMNGRNVDIVDGFRAYRSAGEGATDYLRLLGTRYRSALQAAEQGDVNGFAAALKRAGYYTAPQEGYAAALRSLVTEGAAGGDGRGTELFRDEGGGPPPAGAVLTVALAQTLDRVTACAAKVAAPVAPEEAEADDWTQDNQNTSRRTETSRWVGHAGGTRFGQA